MNAAIVVVELYPDNVEAHGAIEHLVVGGVGVGALGCSGEDVLFTTSRVHQTAELVSESSHVGDACLEIEIETIDHGATKGAQGSGAGLLWAKGGPDQVRASNRGGCGLESAFCVGSAPNGKDNGFAVSGLAGLDVLSIV